jgi:DNA repair exonuclease SbcCD ATPase subunit
MRVPVRFIKNIERVPVRFIEMVSLLAALIVLMGTNERRVPIGFLSVALGLNLFDRGMIARKLTEQEQKLKQLQAAAIPTLAKADERRSLEGRVGEIEERHQSFADALQELNAETIMRDQVQPVLERFEGRFARLKSDSEQLSEIQTLLDGLRTAPKSLAFAHETLQTHEEVFEQLRRQYLTQETINQLIEHISTIRPHTYELVWDMEASHSILIEALKNFQHRLILVNPWLSEYVFTKEIKRTLEDTLRGTSKKRIKYPLNSKKGFPNLIREPTHSFDWK